MCALICVRSLARKVPTNYILLTIFTVAESILVAYACASVQDRLIVLQAAVMTAGITVALTIYAMTTKTDFTMCWGFAWVLGFSLFFFGIFAFISGSEFMYKFYCLLGVLAGGLYILIDTQLIMGGKSWQLSEDEYIVGAMILYIDIIYLFLKLLALLRR